MAWGDNFAEGDSGVTTPNIEAWNAIQRSIDNDKLSEKPKSLVEVYAQILASALTIAKNEENSATDRISALDVARQSMTDYCRMFGTS